MTQPTLFDTAEITKSAIISPCGLYRYKLTRGACHGTDSVNFIMLNPSTADHEKDDPTIRRCLGYAKNWGYADLVVTNLFALRSTDPSGLKAADDPIGPDNDRILLEIARSASAVVCAWGNHGSFMSRSDTVKRMLKEAGVQLACLRLTSAGEPSHPLYLPADLMAASF